MPLLVAGPDILYLEVGDRFINTSPGPPGHLRSTPCVVALACYHWVPFHGHVLGVPCGCTENSFVMAVREDAMSKGAKHAHRLVPLY